MTRVFHETFPILSFGEKKKFETNGTCGMPGLPACFNSYYLFAC